jgi:hypothetical protein
MIRFLTFFSDAFRIIWQEDIERSQKREMKQDKFSAFNESKTNGDPAQESSTANQTLLMNDPVWFRALPVEEGPGVTRRHRIRHS